ncbi:restriction system-associated AAA family ATPase [Elizabethkingia ursingii]|uniref:restriction system-associated AAA family ATPase n=1 Tax=Elizabethkingia ursingii TaxID=1756150 RepID=UPI002012F375|nr:restriction system-associated AAA family ATPase [Elizabethkingia ursingii]MCL1665126.1 restriction system-associated AAA family ATPase [Elizabethkingia ursingii]
MKLLKIEINSEFSSLKPGFKLYFRSPFKDFNNDEWKQFHPFCFAGLNGSGKSNVLEALANIFFHLECCANVNHPQNFINQFSPSECKPNAYKLEYYIKPQSEKGECTIESMVLVNVVKEVNKIPEMTWKPYPFDQESPRKIDLVSDRRASIPAGGKNYLPDLIIGYSSGENETLSIPFLKSRLLQFDEYEEAIRKGYEFELKKSKSDNIFPYEKPESSLIYIDYEMSQAVLLANYLFQDKEMVLKPLESLLNITDIKRFRMNLNIGHELNKQPILKQYHSTIEKFRKCSTASFQNGSRLWFDFLVNNDTRKAFQKNFNNDIFELFQAFQVLYTLNYREADYETKSDVYESRGYYTQGKVSISGPSNRVFYFLDYYINKRDAETGKIKELLLKQLSDGEQQFLHSLGICLMLKNKSALLLLDEPETHFNPDWRSKFISMLGKSLEGAESNNMMRDVLITSHSPFIISDCLPDNVIVFKKGKQPEKPSFNTFGASIGVITSKIFNNNQTIGDFSNDEIQKFERFFEEQNYDEALQILNSRIGDSVEKLLFINKMKNKYKL